MIKGNYRFKIETLLQIARVTTDDELREQLLSEALELLDDVDISPQFSPNNYSTKYKQEATKAINRYLESTDRDRINSITVWEEGLGLLRDDMTKKDSRFILSLIRLDDSWEYIGKQRCYGSNSAPCFERKKIGGNK